MQVILWNPPNADVLKLSLKNKLELLSHAVTQLNHVRDGSELCALVGPDYLFFHDVPYGVDDFNAYHVKVQAIADQLPQKVLFVAGSMQWVDPTSKKLFVSALIASRGQVLRYDKKHKAGITEDVKGYEFEAGTASGRFQWQGFRCGLEICQDHEKEVLKKSGPLDVHILISYGQCGRARNLALDPNKRGVFIQCELETTQYYADKKMGSNPESYVSLCSYERHRMLGLVPNESKQALTDCASTKALIKFKQCAVEMPVPTKKGAPPLRLKRPVWQPDSEVSRCTKCMTSFGVFTRKHHCRQCGRIFCSSCSSKTMIVVKPATKPGEQDVEQSAEAVRVCDSCANG
ncbi:MAG TPA: FYVE zinc finger domain-containing protein [Archangium sp.]|uniref:FYVE zinc finger domain-containing protein n=1 Tax=Archangium sp. TaxID=1872627 RepID=UPI002E371AFA|nr:FYVE zinc finger domain-containing protein [Archangium sp.]HEX5753491.1 FYVE zinc finger domain-containing protein [Archangium sp.]